MHKKRWYDIDPTISLAVSLLRNSDDEQKQTCADFIIDYAKHRDIKLRVSPVSDAFNFILRRWYDQNKALADAFAYFEQAPPEIQKEIALEIISTLQQV